MRYFFRCLSVFLMIVSIFIGCRVAVEPLGGAINHSILRDGEYDGISRGGPVKVRVKIVVRNQCLEEIKVVKHSTLMGRKAENTVINNIISAQSTNVDAVSGATVSSRVIMNAVQNAIDKAVIQ